MTTPNTDDLLGRVRALLAKAEVTEYPEEAEALTAKASALMAKYGIERAQLGALHPESDKPGDKKFTIPNPWGDVKRHLLAGVASALRCQCVQINVNDQIVLHVFGYESDLERAELLWTSLLVQMARALAREYVPATGNTAKAWRRSFMLGYCSAVKARIVAAEAAATKQAEADDKPGMSTALVLVDRSLVVKTQVSTAYPKLRKRRVTYSGSGYGAGHREGQKADIGGAKVGRSAQRALN